jgi:hypothetical protein
LCSFHPHIQAMLCSPPLCHRDTTPYGEITHYRRNDAMPLCVRFLPHKAVQVVGQIIKKSFAHLGVCLHLTTAYHEPYSELYTVLLKDILLIFFVTTFNYSVLSEPIRSINPCFSIPIVFTVNFILYFTPYF